MSMRHIDDRSNRGSAGNSQTVDRLDQSNQSAGETVRRGQHAWARVRGNHTWDDWLQVGAALGILRTEAMREAHVNDPFGRIYNEAFGALLGKFGFENIDKGDRARLFEVMDKLAEIERWRATLTQSQRLPLNHPTTVLRRWKTAMVVTSPQDPRKASAVAKLKQSIVALSEENHRLKREVDAGGGVLWTFNDKAEEIAATMLTKLSPAKAKRVAETILNKLKNINKSPEGQHAVFGGRNDNA
jgi:hypothetical protein